jgi:5'-nucleotidase
MKVDLSKSLVIGISSQALFDLHVEGEIFDTKGIATYVQYQRENEDNVLKPGNGFPLIKALLGLNAQFKDYRAVEVIIMSRNSPDISVRIFRSIEAHGLDIGRAAFTSGESLAPYLSAFQVDLFLSKYEEDVQAAVDAGIAGAVIYDPPTDFGPATDKIRIAFDGDAVLFHSPESDEIFSQHGVDAFHQHERENANNPLPEGPFMKLFKTLALLRSEFEPSEFPFRIALVTARMSPAHERVIRTFRKWGITVDEAFFLGGLSKDAVLKAFRAHMFFDDQESNLASASQIVPSARVPLRTEKPMTANEENASKVKLSDG